MTMVAHKVVWTAAVAAGLLVNLGTLRGALRRRRAVRASGRNGGLRILAHQGVREEAITLFLQLAFAALAVAAWGLDEPILPQARVFYIACGWAFAACAAAQATGSLLGSRDRRRLVRLLDDAEGNSGHGPTAGHPN